MGDAPNLVSQLLPRSMWPPPPPSPPPFPSQRSNLPMLYYSLVVVGTAALVLAIYNFIIVKWRAHQHQDRSERRQNQLVEVTTGASLGSRSLNQEFLASFTYKKGSIDAQDKEIDYECPVCLSAFEEGEEVRVLPKCKHSFHAPCIDMWLYSHSDCPLCRAHVGPPTVYRRYLVVGSPSENSREGLLGLPA